MTVHAATPLLSPLSALSPESSSEGARLHALTSALARGKDDAWREFHREFGPAIFRHAIALTRGDVALADETLQQAYLRIARYVRPSEVEAAFGAWLRIVTRSAFHDCRRRRQSFWRRLLPHDPAGDEPVAGAAETEDTLDQALAAAMQQLPAHDRDLLEAKYFRSASVREIALSLGVSAKTIESRLTRARVELRQRLAVQLKHHE